MNRIQLVIFVVCEVCAFASPRVAKAASDFDLILGLEIAADCSQAYCYVPGKNSLSPGSFFRNSTNILLDSSECSANVQNRSGFVGYNARVTLGPRDRALFIRSQSPRLRELGRLRQKLGTRIRFEVDLDFREDIEQGRFETLVQSVPEKCRRRVANAPGDWHVIKSRYFGREVITVSVAGDMTKAIFEDLRPFVAQFGSEYDISAASTFEVTLKSKRHVLYALETEPVVHFIKMYPDVLVR